jgi:hypothetical protein
MIEQYWITITHYKIIVELTTQTCCLTNMGLFVLRGTVETFSSRDSDVLLLKKLVFHEGFEPLKRETEKRYYAFRKGKLLAAMDKEAAKDAEPEKTKYEPVFYVSAALIFLGMCLDICEWHTHASPFARVFCVWFLSLPQESKGSV